MPGPALHDLRLTLRSLRRSPGFAVTVVLSVAIGIGACVSVFAAIDAARFRPLPYDDPDRLVWIYGTAVGDEVPAYPIGEDVFRDWSARRLRSIESLALEGSTEALLRGSAEPVSATVGLVSGGYFRVAGARPRLGRTLLPDDDVAGAGPAAVLSYPFWVRRFGADRAVLGRTLRLAGTTATVVGVMPPGMRLPGDVVVPLSAATRELAPTSTSILARLRPGATLAQAKAELRRLARTSALADSAGREPRSATAYSIPEMARRISSSELWLLLGAVGLVFLIAVGNLANLVLVRAQSRARDLAVRAALGARRCDLVRQLVVESLALTLPGGALGAVVAVWGKALAGRFVPPEVAPTIAIDARALAVSFALAVLVGVVDLRVARVADDADHARPRPSDDDLLAHRAAGPGAVGERLAHDDAGASRVAGRPRSAGEDQRPADAEADLAAAHGGGDRRAVGLAELEAGAARGVGTVDRVGRHLHGLAGAGEAQRDDGAEGAVVVEGEGAVGDLLRLDRRLRHRRGERLAVHGLEPVGAGDVAGAACVGACGVPAAAGGQQGGGAGDDDERERRPAAGKGSGHGCASASSVGAGGARSGRAGTGRAWSASSLGPRRGARRPPI